MVHRLELLVVAPPILFSPLLLLLGSSSLAMHVEKEIQQRSKEHRRCICCMDHH